jgi:hypothetical protein
VFLPHNGETVGSNPTPFLGMPARASSFDLYRAGFIYFLSEEIISRPVRAPTERAYKHYRLSIGRS